MTKLGTGSSGGVYLATDKATKAKVAIKNISLKALKSPGEVPVEVAMLRKLDHPKIVRLYEVFRDAKCLYLVLEACLGGEILDKILQETKIARWTEHKAATVFKQLLSAVIYLHTNKVVHRDLRCENILLQDQSSDSMEIKLINFGLCVEAKDRMTTKVGSPFYIAPDVLNGSYTAACETWSCGVIVYILISGMPPFAGADDAEVLQNVKTGTVDFPASIWGKVSKDAVDLIKNALTVDPKRRPDMKWLIEHTWLKKGDVMGKQPLPSLAKQLMKFNQARRLKKMCLTVLASQMQEKDLQELQKYFVSLDKNGDGTISRAELKQGLDYMAKALPGMKLEDLDGLMTIDSDGSGFIDYREFIAAAVDKKVYEQRDALWRAFRTFDLDGNGKIEKHELKKFMEGDGAATVGDDKVLAILKESDKNGDGAVDFEEFMAMMREE
eukprot:TRINITY_DN96498_c0_g1_i1.p1 TRINITY_DN96498_c0_g1~~TRINITY_DN96498_c0_g1_i1.p1  ORF type:complete len:505 (-),score=123.69 TRINITY_DN96498_c0_g1_i1:90-1409(-)